MDENTLFRSALHGFKREDVMDYVTKTTRQHEAEVFQLQSDLVATQKELEETTASRDMLRKNLTDLTVERDKLRAEKRDFEALKAQLEEAKEQIALLQRQRQESDERHAAELEEVRNAGLEALKQYQEDANGYAILSEKVGRIMLHAENAGEAIRIHAQEEADSILASAQEQADALTVDAKTKVAELQAAASSLHAQAEDFFQQSKQQFETTQSYVNESISRAMSEVDQLRSMLLDLSDAFSSTQVSFDPPVCDPAYGELVSVGE